MLQQAVEQFLRDRGWAVASDGRLIRAEKDGEEAMLGFLLLGEAVGYLERVADSEAALGAVLMDAIPEAEVAQLEEAGVTCFPREALEDVVLSAWLRPDDLDASPFVRFLEGG
ncbi:MAG TPA: hypothetical protein VJ326_00815 [Thermoplasmata archaeon]|nr:hypothetical protein [Thermoplasmata archaeon]